METGINPGLELTLEMRVSVNDTARMVGSGSLEVLSTPSMVAFMEKTAMMAVSSLLPEGFSTVGTKVNISHLKPSPEGSLVKCRALLTGIDNRRLTFDVEVRDNAGIIGSGIHERYIIDEEKFMKKLKP